MDYFKKIERSVTISADKRSTVDLQVDVWSQDLNVTKFILKLDTTDSTTIDLTNATVRVAMVYSQDGKDVKIEAVGIVEDVATQKIAYVMGDRLAGFEGTVTAGFYVTLSTGQRIDIQNVTFNMRKSLLDKDLDVPTEDYYQTFDDILADVQAEGETAKTQINQVLPSVQSVGETAKTQINAVVTDVRATGEKAKTDINAVLPSVKAEISEIKTEIENIPDIPDLFVAYADDSQGSGFSKTDNTKLYKGYGVKNSTSPTDYRWERNVDNFQIGGRNLWITSKMIGGIKETLSDNHITGQKECWRINNGQAITFKIEPEFSKRMYGKTFTFSAWVKWENVVQGTNIFNAFNIFKQVTKYKNSSSGAESSTYYPSPSIKRGTSDWVKVSYTYTYNISGYDMLRTSIFFNIDGAQSGTAWVTGIKVEEGNNATDWTPAPEDQVSQAELNELKSYIGYTDTDVYGVEIDMTNKTFKRLAGSIGKNAGADFDNINAFKRRRCNVTDTGVVLAYYGESNYTESGLTTVEIVKNTVTYPVGTPVQVMVEQPKFYYKVVPLTVEPIANGKGYHMRKGRYYISDYPKEGFKVHPAFVRNGVVKEKIYLSAYEGSIFDASASNYLLNDEQVADFSADKLSSVANAKPCSGVTQNLSRSNVRLLAHNRGNGWEQQTVQTVSLTQLLFLIEYNTFNMQTAIGMGATQKTNVSGVNMAENTGGSSNLGNASGAVTNTNGIQIVSYRGEENPYGNIWKFVDGINVMANGIHDIYVADHDFDDKQSTGSYADVGFTLAKTSGYISAFGYSSDFDWLFLTSEATGNSSVPVGDYFYQEYTATDDGGWRTVLLGAAWDSDSGAGGFYWGVGTPSVDRNRNLSGRLVYVGG